MERLQRKALRRYQREAVLPSTPARNHSPKEASGSFSFYMAAYPSTGKALQAARPWQGVDGARISLSHGLKLD